MSQLKPRTTTVTIYDGVDLARLESFDGQIAGLTKRIEEAPRSAPRLMGDPDLVGERADLVAQRDAFAAEAESRGVQVVLHALPRKAFRALVREHPPREGVTEDLVLSVNMETMPDVLLPRSIDPTASTIAGDLTEFLESLSDFDYYDRLFLEAFRLNRGQVLADPTLRLGSTPNLT